uniref:Uncharacterized protein n=1 Tax=Anguilla anguilla TaxID=7936 RepID=A0A0E9U8Z0_ANGAN
MRLFPALGPVLLSRGFVTLVPGYGYTLLYVSLDKSVCQMAVM